MHLSSFLSVFVILFNRSIIRAWCLIEQSLHLVSREVKWVSLLVRELTQVASKESLLWFFDVAGNTTTANMTILIEDFLKLELLSGSSKFLLFLDWFKNLARTVCQKFSWLNSFLLYWRQSLKTFFRLLCDCVIRDRVWTESSND